MKKPFSILVTATIIGVLLAASVYYSIKTVAYADSSNNEWQLTVTGLVEHPLNLTLADIVSMPQTTVHALLICVGPPSFLVTEGNWTGVRLQLLLQEAGVLPETVKVAFYAQDGYTTDLPVDTALRDDVILAYEKDGAPLSETLRLVVPGCWGYKWIAQVTGIELVNYNFLGKFESIGYSDEADTAGQTAPQLRSPLGSNLTQNSPPSPSPSFLPSPSPNPSNSSSSPPSQTQNPQSDSFSPLDTISVLAGTAIIIICVPVAIVLKKRTKQKPSEEN
jgi:DMSO/TMAO reductase YedYZ molybdopterin-dependent catalytic subunit